MGTEELSARRLRNKKRRQGRVGRSIIGKHYELGGTMVNRVSDTEYNACREWLRDYINHYCIVRDTRMPGKLPGTWYTWMFYLRKGLFNPDFNIAVAKMFIYKMERIDPELDFQITGLETAATPMLAGIPLVAKLYGVNINSFVVRKQRKEYGLLNVFEGRPNQKVSVIIDDLCNSGTSMAQCKQVLDNENMAVAPVAFTIVNKGRVAGADMNLPENMQVISLFTLDDFGLSNPSH